MDRLHTEQIADFAANATVSSEVDLRNFELVALITDSTFVTSDITFTDSNESGATKLFVVDSANVLVNITGVVADRKYILSYLGTEGLEYVKLNSSASQPITANIRLILKERA